MFAPAARIVPAKSDPVVLTTVPLISPFVAPARIAASIFSATNWTAAILVRIFVLLPLLSEIAVIL